MSFPFFFPSFFLESYLQLWYLEIVRCLNDSNQIFKTGFSSRSNITNSWEEIIISLQFSFKIEKTAIGKDTNTVGENIIDAPKMRNNFWLL